MLETVSQRFQGSCMMIMRQTDTEVTFLGSGFLVHNTGYLLTAARLVSEDDGLVAVSPETRDGFVPITKDEVASIPVEVLGKDLERDVALLKFKPDIEINMPDGILGSAEKDPRGSMLMSLGVPFGFSRFHTVIVSQSILSGRVQSKSGTNLIVFDRRVQYGDVGGPLVSVTDGRVIGVVGGVFDPVELEGRAGSEGVRPINSDLSYAASIEYGAALLEQALKNA